MNDKETISIDGSFGEGGGQILRTSLSLACITNRTLKIYNIRANRPKPGLAKQHLCSIEAACKISSGKAIGAELGSRELLFQPGTIQGGDFHFDTGSAGSATLVIQTVLPALFLADTPSKVTVTGGTHNPMAPPYDFIAETFLPAIASGGFRAECKLVKYGFYPAGGGKISLEIQPREKKDIEKSDAFNFCNVYKDYQINARIYTSKLPKQIAQRQEKLLKQSGLNFQNIECIEAGSVGPGNAVCIALSGCGRKIVFSAFGMKGKPSEKVIIEAASPVMQFLESSAAIDHYLADQLLIYMAIAKGGSFTTDVISKHTKTNIEVIKKFLSVNFQIKQMEKCFKVSCVES